MAEGTILLVDDEESVQKLLTYPLERDGFTVVHARDGEEALARFAEHDVDLVVLDLMLPRLDGLEVCKRLRALDLRADVDRSHGHLKAMIRDAQLAKIPYACVIGDKEVEAQGVSPRKHGTGKEADLGLIKLDDFIAQLQREAAIPF